MGLSPTDDATITLTRRRLHQESPAYRVLYRANPAWSKLAIEYVGELSSPHRETFVVFSRLDSVIREVPGTGTADAPRASGWVGLGTTDPTELGPKFYWPQLQGTLRVGNSTLALVEEVPSDASVLVEQSEEGAEYAKWLFDRLRNANTELSDRLERLGSLDAGWDGYGGHPPTPKAVEMTAILLLAAHGLTRGSLSTPFVAPLPDGGLEIEWELESGTELMLVVPPGGTNVSYLLDELTESGEIIESEGAVPRDASVSELIDRLTR